jgi:anti-anti-sigma factor
MSASLMSLSILRDREGVSVAVGGEIDSSNAGSLDMTLCDLLASGWEHIAVDLSEVSSMDQSAVTAIVTAHDCAVDLGCEIALTGLSEPAADILAHTGADQILTLAAPVSRFPRHSLRQGTLPDGRRDGS